jgi:putative transcriptional regulator
MNSISLFRTKCDNATQTNLARVLNNMKCEVNPKGWTGQLISHYETGRTIPSTLRMRMIVEALNKLGADCTLDQVFPPPVDLAA